MKDSNYIKIYTGSFIIVQQMISALEEIGINAVVKDETESGLISIFGATNPNLQRIYVHKDELDKAVPIVEEISSNLKD
ncbi:MAG TPA: DUF2007 domain-containing protein [Yeosuana sp.]